MKVDFVCYLVYTSSLNESFNDTGTLVPFIAYSRLFKAKNIKFGLQRVNFASRSDMTVLLVSVYITASFTECLLQHYLSDGLHWLDDINFAFSVKDKIIASLITFTGQEFVSVTNLLKLPFPSDTE